MKTIAVNRLIEGPLNLSWKVIILQLLQSGHHYQKLGLLNGRLRVCHRVAPSYWFKVSKNRTIGTNQRCHLPQCHFAKSDWVKKKMSKILISLNYFPIFSLPLALDSHSKSLLLLTSLKLMSVGVSSSSAMNFTKLNLQLIFLAISWGNFKAKQARKWDILFHIFDSISWIFELILNFCMNGG